MKKKTTFRYVDVPVNIVYILFHYFTAKIPALVFTE